MVKHLSALAFLLGVFFSSVPASSEDSVTLHPDFPVVSGEYQLSTNWTITLTQEMNRRVEDQNLVLWRPGITVWMSLWGNDHEETIRERLEWFQSVTSPYAFDVSVRADDTPARYSYRLNEDGEEGTVFAFYGFALKEDGHLQIAIYVDREGDLTDAKSLFDSLR